MLRIIALTLSIASLIMAIRTSIDLKKRGKELRETEERLRELRRMNDD